MIGLSVQMASVLPRDSHTDKSISLQYQVIMIIGVIHSRLRQSVTQQAQAGRQAGREDASDDYRKSL